MSAQQNFAHVEADYEKRRSELAIVTSAVAEAQAELKNAEAALAHTRSAGAAQAAAAASLVALKEEIAALEARRPEPVLTESAESLRALIAEREDKIRTMAEAPDPNWGTVHTIAKSLIKQVDLLDDLIAHLSKHASASESLQQLSIFRANLLDILTEYDIAPFRYPAGFVIDLPTRKKIQIVESTVSSTKHSTILECFRPGYICTNGTLGLPTLLRKAEVGIASAS
jgi:chromosome segregation ATPase